MNTKGIMLEFIVTVILALIIFIPACYGVSKLFRTSAQAEESFQEFANALEDFAESEKERSSFLLIMDEKTLAAVFAGPGAHPLFPAPELEEGQAYVPQSLAAPAACTSFPCACLCREIHAPESSANAPAQEFSCRQEKCRVLEGFPLQETFVVSRLDPVYGSQKSVRRQVVLMEKEDGKIKLSIR